MVWGIAPILGTLRLNTALTNVAAMIANKPATKSESARFYEAEPTLPGLANDLSETMIFGPRRRLVVQAFHGLAKPDEDTVQRAHSP